MLRPPSTRATIVVCSLLSLVPLLAWWPQWRFLFFFHDDWELLDGAAHLGFTHWLAQPFLGESVFPLFKLLWLGAVRLTGGSYLALVILLWITHVAICLLFGWLMARFGLPPAALAFAVLTFGLAWTNIETLAWATQWNAQLAVLFFLSAWHFLLSRRSAACFLCLLGSGLCSSRGILSGIALAVFVLLMERRPARLCALCLAPSALLAATMWLFVPHHQLQLRAALLYAGDYLLLNPLYRPLPIPRQNFHAGALLICGVVKAMVYFLALRKSRAPARPFLWTLLAFDVIVAMALGYSRWSTGLGTATSSRYQYIPLLCFGPMAGILIARLRVGAQVAILLLCVCGLVFPWKRHAEQWATERGIQIREALESEAPENHFDPSSLTAGRARELIRLYGLH